MKKLGFRPVNHLKLTSWTSEMVVKQSFMSNFNFETVFTIEELPLFDPSACNPLYRHRACTTTKAKPLMSLLPALPILSPRWKSLTHTSLITCYFSFTKMNRYLLHTELEERPVFLYEHIPIQIRKLRTFTHYPADNQCVGICCTIYMQLQDIQHEKCPLWVHCLCP